MSLTVYGIKNCDTMKKTFSFLEEKRTAYVFFDYKKQAPDTLFLREVIAKSSLAAVVNTQGTTYKKMGDAEKVALKEQESALPILVAHPSMIKRPIILYPDGSITLGFQPELISSKLP
jgi:Spx/MgsR family transcriptional regulator